jgi:hypothetical protein
MEIGYEHFTLHQFKEKFGVTPKQFVMNKTNILSAQKCYNFLKPSFLSVSKSRSAYRCPRLKRQPPCFFLLKTGNDFGFEAEEQAMCPGNLSTFERTNGLSIGIHFSKHLCEIRSASNCP